MSLNRKNDNKKLDGRFWITGQGHYMAGSGRVDLLKRIKNEGSISAAAKQMEMSYKAAWDSVNIMNKLWSSPLVERTTGGRHGGGTKLTKTGEEFIELYDKYNVMFEKILNFIEENPENINMIDKVWLKTSADNVFHGKITKIEQGAVNCLVHMETEAGVKIVASITVDGIDRMNLAEGEYICALVSAQRLIVIENNSGEQIITSARNKFGGAVSVVKKGAVNSEIVLDMDGGAKLKIVVTNESADNLSLTFGKNICAYCKASDIIILS